MYTESGIRLAPFYDLFSSEVYSEKLVDHHIAMLINGKEKYDALRPKDFIALFQQLGLNATNMMKLMAGRFSKIVRTAEMVKLEHALDAKIIDGVINIIKKRMLIFLSTDI